MSDRRKLVAERVEAALAALRGGARTALEIAPVVHGEPVTEINAGWFLSETLCYLRHLKVEGRVAHRSDGGPEGWEPV